MDVKIFPSRLSGTVEAPPSKSMTHRLLLCAALSEGTSIVRGVSPSGDVLATMDCLRALGAEVTTRDGIARIRGMDPAAAKEALLPCGESGSTLRFLIPLCMLSGRRMQLRGSRTLLKRPLTVYEEIFTGQGSCEGQPVFSRKTPGELLVEGRLLPGGYEIDGSVSSQFITGLLFALPLLAKDSLLRLRPPVKSRPYIDMTMAALEQFGVHTFWRGDLEIVIPGGQRYRPQDVKVEGDWSNAAFFRALDIPVTGLDPGSLQGDRVCEAYFRALDRGPAELSLADCPDLGPVLFAYAALRRGGRFTGTSSLRIKESDRGAAMRRELSRFAVPVQIRDNEILVGCGVKPPTEPLFGHNDHRIVMALAVLCLKTGGTIRGAEAAAKSFPDFFQKLTALGAQIEYMI